MLLDTNKSLNTTHKHGSTEARRNLWPTNEEMLKKISESHCVKTPRLFSGGSENLRGICLAFPVLAVLIVCPVSSWLVTDVSATPAIFINYMRCDISPKLADRRLPSKRFSFSRYAAR